MTATRRQRQPPEFHREARPNLPNRSVSGVNESAELIESRQPPCECRKGLCAKATGVAIARPAARPHLEKADREDSLCRAPICAHHGLGEDPFES